MRVPITDNKPEEDKSKSDEKTIKSKIKKRTKFTILSMVNIVWYTIIVLVMSAFGRTVPSELTVAWFAAWTIELALLFGIKVASKDGTGYNEEYDMIEKEDEEMETTETFDQIQQEDSVPDYDDCVG